ncbi:MAG: NAD(P)-dependent oxidoreductase [Desulfovibrionaceae bacterium]|nr:NAD(P)-dependent oxidoreductase [Desulfovibrionaceae bacterium]
MFNSTPTNILVSGATGFVGSHLLPLLQKTGANITCLVRKSSNISNLPNGVKWVTADLISGEGLNEAFLDQHIFIHLAALLFGLNWQDYLKANVKSAQNICAVIENLKDRGPKATILVSSLAAAGPCAIPPGLNETCKPAPVSAYGWSKLLVERTWQSSYQGRLVILRPGIIYGSGDRGLLPLFQGVKKGFAVSPGYGREFPVSIIHGTDMARAIIKVLEENAQGIYHVSDGQNYTMAQFCSTLGQILRPQGAHIFHIPLSIMHISAALTTLAYQIYARLIHQERGPNWNSDKYLEAKEAGWLLDASRLLSLGYSPTYALEAGLKEAVSGYKARGWL